MASQSRSGSARVTEAAGGGRPRGYQPGFVGRHDGLDPVAQAEFGEDPADMDFTVPSDRSRLAAISLLDMPAAMRQKTSCSRPVRASLIWAPAFAAALSG